MGGSNQNSSQAAQFAQLPSMTSGVSFKTEALEANGNSIDTQAEHITSLEGRQGHLPVQWPHFGVVGMGVSSVHDKAIERQADALAKGKKALQSWKDALKSASKNYRQAEDASGDPFKDLNLDPSKLGPGADLGNLGNMPAGPSMPDTSGLGGTPGLDTKLPGSDLDGTNLPSTDPSKVGLPSTDPSKVDLPKYPDPSQVQQPDMKVPDIDSALNGMKNPDLNGKLPDGTNLAQYDPNSLTNPQLRNPDLGSLSPDATGTRIGTGPNAGGGPGTGIGTGSGGAGAGGLPAG
ncbi:hypothetical protein, partial [Nonomuraea rhizosphaerae]|uniref:hypothetical protein n=1 Tax=Nonomuraea rhizosphaerae TaxID=2665663 RepID=UPI001C5E4B6C